MRGQQGVVLGKRCLVKYFSYVTMPKFIYLYLLSLALVGCASVDDERVSGHASTPATRPALVNYAHSLIGIPYKFGGVSPKTGFDCSGLVMHVYSKKAGISLPHNAKSISEHGRRIARKDLRPGDLVFYNTLGDDYSHVGVYIGKDKFIHSPSSGKKVGIVDMKMSYWKQRFNGVRRLLN